MKINNSQAKSISGNVLRIERSSIHDGGGLRTVLFLKGCPLNCPWCSTPESKYPGEERGYSSNLCIACERCITVCPSEALSIDTKNKKVDYDKTKCGLCFRCIDVCLISAIKKYGCRMTVQQVMDEISKDEIFYYHSGGGITISGGEPLAQPNFTAAILSECRKAGINTAIESSFYAKTQDIELILPLLNDLYIDIKHMDDTLHESWIGEGNTIILDNLLKTESSPHPVNIVIRIPLIRGFNDDRHNLMETLNFAEKLSKVKLIELLPYHRLGSETYGHLGLNYTCSELTTHSIKELEELSAFMTSKSKTVSITAGSGFNAE